MLCMLFSELEFVRKYLTLLLFGNFFTVCTVNAGRVMLGSKRILKFHCKLFFINILVPQVVVQN